MKPCGASRPDLGAIGSFGVQKVETLDGVKFFLDAPTYGNGAEAWVLVRASGTEPLLRIYCEAASADLVSQILKETEAFVGARSENLGLMSDNAHASCFSEHQGRQLLYNKFACVRTARLAAIPPSVSSDSCL